MEKEKTIPPYLFKDLRRIRTVSRTINRLFKVCYSKRVGEMLYKKLVNNESDMEDWWYEIREYTGWHDCGIEYSYIKKTVQKIEE